MKSKRPIVLCLEHVSHFYSRDNVLHDISLDVREGEFLSVIGPSGCGKSTLLKIMCGVVTPTMGDVAYGGHAISDLSSTEHGILMVWQSLALFPHLDVASNVGFGLTVRKIDKRKQLHLVQKVLELVDLAGFEKRQINTLSGGEQQRVALARALVLNPAVLLLDEPFGGVDRHLRTRLISTIRELHQRLDVTMIMVTHEQSEALALSTRIVVMRQGQIEQIGTPEQILHAPQNRFVAEFVGDRNILEGDVQGLKNGIITVDTKAGVLKASFPSWLPLRLHEGQKVSYIIDSHLVKVGIQDDNIVPGTVCAIVDQGSWKTIELSTVSHVTIKCKNFPLGIARTKLLSLAEKTMFSWSCSDAYVLPV